MQDLATTITLLANAPATFDALLRPLPASFANASEGEGSWTVAQVLAHLIHCESTDWMVRVQTILRSGESKAFAPLQREASFTATMPPVAELLTSFAERRAANLIELRSLALTAEDLQKRGVHPAFGPVTLSQLVSTWAAHDLTHLHQLSRILAYPYRDAVGPWEKYLGVLHCNGHSETAAPPPKSAT